nr:hypothetical protein [Mucilaginibacter sp. X5P1]
MLLSVFKSNNPAEISSQKTEHAYAFYGSPNSLHAAINPHPRFTLPRLLNIPLIFAVLVLSDVSLRCSISTTLFGH